MTPREQWIAFQTIVVREIRRFMRIWVQTLVPPVITMSLYFVIFGKLIGTQIGDMSGYSYMEFVVPGLIMMSVITNSYSNVVSSFYGAKFAHNIEELLVSPTPNYIIFWGFIIGGVVRGLLVGLLVTLVALLFTRLSVHSIPLTVLVVFLTAVLFSIGGLINAVFANSFDDISIVPTFVLTPLTYLGGVFYSIELLPSFWAGVSQANPVLYMVNTFRYGVLGHSDIPVATALGMIALAVTLGAVYALHLLKHSPRLRH